MPFGTHFAQNFSSFGLASQSFVGQRHETGAACCVVLFLRGTSARRLALLLGNAVCEIHWLHPVETRVARVHRLEGGAQQAEKGGPKDHFAIYLVLETPFFLGHVCVYLPLENTLSRTISVVQGSEQPLQHA